MKIEKLEIKSRNVGEQLKFYRDLLGLAINNYSEETFEVQVGFSVVKFVSDPGATPYHIAIHIPGKQERLALNWVKDRVPVLKNNNEEIIDFSNWHAYSLYFYDADKNIMEFISRSNLYKPGKAVFSGKSLLGIAEVGLATNDIREKYEFLNQNFRLDKYDGSFDKFCAIGDDEGLLITIDKNEKDWFPTNDKAYSSDFAISFQHKNKSRQLKFQNDKVLVIPGEA
jgi:catechol-2,3-dioxygenase